MQISNKRSKKYIPTLKLTVVMSILKYLQIAILARQILKTKKSFFVSFVILQQLFAKIAKIPPTTLKIPQCNLISTQPLLSSKISTSILLFYLITIMLW